MQTNVLTKRKEQLKHWELSEMNKIAPVRRPVQETKVKFQDSDIFLSACISGDEEEVKDLLDKGANINVSTVDGVTALHQAVIDDNLDIVRFLVENNADINAQDNEGWTPLHAAVCCGSLPIAKYLCEKGSDLTLTNSDKELAIDLAEEDEIRLYLEEQLRLKNVNPEKCRQREFSLMMDDCAEWIRKGRYLDKPHSKTGASALHVAASKGYNQLIGMLIRAGADINAQDAEGWTPLHAAAHWAEEDACRILMENGASLDSETFAGQNVLMVADKNIIDYLGNLRQKFSELRNGALKHQQESPTMKETLKSSLICNNGSVNIENNKFSEVDDLKDDSINNVNAPIISPNYASATFTIPSAAGVQPNIQFAGCTPKPNNFILRPTQLAKPEIEMELGEELDDEEEKTVDEVEEEGEDEMCVDEEIVYEDEEEECSAETIESSSSSKAVSTSKSAATSKENSAESCPTISSSSSAVSNRRINTDYMPSSNSETKKIAENGRQSSIASTSSNFSTDETTTSTATSNVSSIVTSSRSVTPKENSSGLYSSDQNIECTVPVARDSKSKQDITNGVAVVSQSYVKKFGSGNITSARSASLSTSVSSSQTIQSNSFTTPYSRSTIGRIPDKPTTPLSLSSSSSSISENNSIRLHHSTTATSNRNTNMKQNFGAIITQSKGITQPSWSSESGTASNSPSPSPIGSITPMFNKKSSVNVTSSSIPSTEKVENLSNNNNNCLNNVLPSFGGSCSFYCTSSGSTSSIPSWNSQLKSSTARFNHNHNKNGDESINENLKPSSSSFDNRLLKPTISTSAKISTKVLLSSSLSSTSQQNHNSISHPFNGTHQQQRYSPFGLKPTTLQSTLMSNSMNGFGGSLICNSNSTINSSSSHTPPTQPSSHRESESERKAKSRLQRHSRRSTQGVTLEHIGEAARQIQGSASSSSIEDGEQQKNLLMQRRHATDSNNEENISSAGDLTKNTLSENNDSLLVSSGNSSTSVLRLNNNNSSNSSLSKWLLQTSTTNNNNNNSMNNNNNNNGNESTTVSAYFKLPSHNYITASSSSSSSASSTTTTTTTSTSQASGFAFSSFNGKNEDKSTASSSTTTTNTNNTSSTSSNNNSSLMSAAASAAKLNRRSQIVRGNRRGTGPVDMEAINAASTTPKVSMERNRFTDYQHSQQTPRNDKRTSSSKPLLSRFKNSSEEVDIESNNIRNNCAINKTEPLNITDGCSIDSINYKYLYEKERGITKQLKHHVDELSQKISLRNDCISATNTMDDQERRSFERRIAALEYEIEKSKQLQADYEKLKDENLALIRVLKKLSK